MLRSLKRLLCPTILALKFAALATAQTQQPSNSGVTLHSGTQLVIVDVVVTDSQQNPVHNLKASDFTLLEKNVPQQIKNFEEHQAVPPAEAAKLQPVPAMPAGIFTNYSPAPLNGTLNVLLLDTLNTPIANSHQRRRSLILIERPA
jgi:VWFA-related protein